LVGTPADPAQASANPEQVVTLSGRGFSLFDVLVYMDCDGNGSKELSFVGPSSVAPDGQTITYQLPKTICTSKVWVLDDYLENKYFLQIVPTVTKYDATYGKFTGVGFIEGGMRAVVAGTTYMDNGPGTEDGIDVTGTNCYFKITGFGGGTPVYVITDGGTSNTYPAP